MDRAGRACAGGARHRRTDLEPRAQAWLANAAAGSRASVLLRPRTSSLRHTDDPGVEQAIGAAFISRILPRRTLRTEARGGETLLRVQSRRRGTFPEGRAQLWARPGSAWVVA